MQGLAFTREERQLLGIHGYLPAVVKSEDEQVKHSVLLLDRYENDLDKFIYLIGLLVSCIGNGVERNFKIIFIFRIVTNAYSFVC